MDAGFSDRWFERRLMKLTAFEKWAMNSPSHAQQTVQEAPRVLGARHLSLPGVQIESGGVHL